MRTLGLLGGMSWESSIEYYRIANERVRARLGGVHSAKIVLDSLDFAEVEGLQAAGDWEQAGALLADRAARLEAHGADLIVVCTNTMHKVADRIGAAIGVPLIHIADTTAEAIGAAGLSRVGLLGTAFTMEQDFYRARVEEHGIEVIVPGPDDRALVHRVIYEELVRGVVRAESRAAYAGVIERLVADGAEGVILGCTEIELLVGPDDSAVPVFATTRLHIEAAVDRALA